ncbi:MAG: hypothetical protein NVS3B10_15690 [Polyangiales bacterium]
MVRPLEDRLASVKKDASRPTKSRTRPPAGGAAAAAQLPDDPDALMATTLRAMDWASKNQRTIVYGVLATVLAAGAFAGWTTWRASRDEKASDLLARGVSAELAPIKQGDEDAEILKRLQFFATEDDKQKTALAAYADARAKYTDSGPGILARLGEAGVHLDRKEWDEALAAYGDVRNSSLAAADGNVRMRCIEGLGYAREGKGNLDDARRSFDELSNLDAKDAKPLGLYHLARLDLQKNDKDAALNKLKNAREALTANPALSSRFLKDQVERMMTRIDPASVPKAPPTGGVGGMPGGGGPGGHQQIAPETLQKLMQQMQGQGGGGAPPMPIPQPPAPKGS